MAQGLQALGTDLCNKRALKGSDGPICPTLCDIQYIYGTKTLDTREAEEDRTAKMRKGRC